MLLKLWYWKPRTRSSFYWKVGFESYARAASRSNVNGTESFPAGVKGPISLQARFLVIWWNNNNIINITIIKFDTNTDMSTAQRYHISKINSLHISFQENFTWKMV